MTDQRSKEIVKEPAIVKVLPEDHFFRRVADLRELIARQAYKLFEEAGFQHGHDLEHWLRAESQLLTSITPEVSQTATAITVIAAVPGFNAENIEIHVQPKQVFITGERLENLPAKKGKRAVHEEHILSRVFNAVELPEEVDPNQATVTFIDGKLRIEVAKANTEQKPAAGKKAVA